MFVTPARACNRVLDDGNHLDTDSYALSCTQIVTSPLECYSLYFDRLTLAHYFAAGFIVCLYTYSAMWVDDGS